VEAAFAHIHFLQGKIHAEFFFVAAGNTVIR